MGIQCEQMVDVCPGGEHVCMNGAEVRSVCVKPATLDALVHFPGFSPPSNSLPACICSVSQMTEMDV